MRPRSALAGFVAFSHGWTWIFWAVPLIRGGDAWAVPNVLFLVVGALGVPLGGAVMTWRAEGRVGLVALGRRIVDPGRVGIASWAVVLLLFPTVTAAGAALDALLDGTPRPLDLTGIRQFSERPLGFAATALFVLLAGPLPEEIGWRGFAQDRLQQRWNALTTALVVGLLWAAWHAPLYFMEGYYQAFDVGPPDPVEHASGILASSVLYAWVYNRTGRSVLAVVLLHFMENFSSDLLGPTEASDLYELLLLAGLVAIVVAREGPALASGRRAEGAAAR